MRAEVSLNIVDRVRIASPCPAKWEDMTGDDKVRHCALCNLKVHDLSVLRREDAEALLAAHFTPGGTKRGERFCGQWRRRADGTVIFGDCPAGLGKLRARVRRSVARVAAIAGLTSLLAACSPGGGRTGGSFAADDDDGVRTMPGEVDVREPIEPRAPQEMPPPSTNEAP